MEAAGCGCRLECRNAVAEAGTDLGEKAAKLFS